MNTTEGSRDVEERQALTSDGSSAIRLQSQTPIVPAIVVHPSDAPSGRGRSISRISRVFSRRRHSDGHARTASSLTPRALSPTVDGPSSSGRSSSVQSEPASPYHKGEDGQNAIQADTSNLSSKKKRLLSDQNVDDALAVARDLVKCLGACASLIPNVTGFDTAMSGLEAILAGVAEARDNAKAVQKVTDNVNELVEAIISTYEQVSGRKIYMGSVTALTNTAAEDSSVSLTEGLEAIAASCGNYKLYSIDALQDAMNQLSIKVGGLKEQASIITKSRWLTQVVRSKSNTAKLEEIGQSIRDARDEFQVYYAATLYALPYHSSGCCRHVQ
ncbi:hypothetical protein WOLCODRAFT_143818 [Wolfiporia cocos MD-104 SS10]|uniref:Uncharacterized protein n=1 Tax=Wolfiporia cocos (strain MD-104) TaxID=742152 RepID=A0A2H3JPZ3_WOLCO|nr:hypothetical protein WOLCODRAFT_143818 [Wolfiporia cocos MD-104 SS10]